MRRLARLGAALAAVAAIMAAVAVRSGEALTDRQAAVLVYVDYARSYGYQVMMARIGLETTKAELQRDATILAQRQELHAKDRIPLIELELAQLKDEWNRRQLVVAEKNLAYVAAEYDAMVALAHHFGGEEVTVDSLYAIFRRGWDAGCEKGPDEVIATKAKRDYLVRLVERARELEAQRFESATSLLEKETMLRIAEFEYESRNAALDRCRALLFPSLDEIRAVGR